nr:MAG TPA: hypothetical protein [Bacteriophage sp.]
MYETIISFMHSVFYLKIGTNLNTHCFIIML